MAILAGIPHAASGSGSNEYVFEAPNVLRLDAEWPGNQTMAGILRHQADEDRDGIVSEAEAMDLLNATRPVGANIGAPIGRVFVNGTEHNRTEIVAVEAAGLAGDADSDQVLTWQWRMRLHFPVTVNDSYAITIDTDNKTRAGSLRMDVDHAHFTAPPGFRFSDVDPPYYASISSNGRGLSFPHGIPQSVGAIVIGVEAAPDTSVQSTPALSWTSSLAIIVVILWTWHCQVWTMRIRTASGRNR